MSVKSRIAKATKVLEQAKEATTLIDQVEKVRGKILRNNTGETMFDIHTEMVVSLETMERWIKQAKVSAKKGYI